MIVTSSDILFKERRTGIPRRESDRVSEKCAAHEDLTRWYAYICEQQDKKIEAVHLLVQKLTDEVVSIRRYISMGIGFIAAMQVFPYLVTILEAIAKR